jgi:two-component system repressor protein LuxO
MPSTRVLVVEDSPTLSAVYGSYLANEPYQLSFAENGSDAFELIKSNPPKLLILDLNLPDMDGMRILQYIHEHQIPTVVVVLTAHGSVDLAVDAMKYGAFDFISKPVEAKRLQITLRNAGNNHELKEIVDIFKEKYERDRYHGFIGSSPAMQSVYHIIENAAPSQATVFVTGESGTGKELCAQALHKQSPRSENEFVALNCAAIPKELMESEIFGHVKGAFTGASKDRDGAATIANGGTLFLDELCEMDMELQSKILRFVQTGTFQKVGSSKLEKVNVRFVCATNKEPLKEVQEGRFREDLYYRLHVIPIQLPALRERGADILKIASKLLINICNEENKAFKKFSKPVNNIFLNYAWPGNVRQLENVIRNLVVLNNGTVVLPSMLPPPLNQSNEPHVVESITSKEKVITMNESIALVEKSHDVTPLWLVEKGAIEETVRFCNGNIPKAAALLEVSPSTIYRKKQTWDELEAKTL